MTLAARFPYMEALLSNGMKESTQREIVLHEERADIWRLVIDFSYGYEITVTDIKQSLD